MKTHRINLLPAFLAAVMLLPLPVFAATNITNVTVNGGATVTVNPADPSTVTVAVTVTTTSNDDWESTSWNWMGDGNPSACVDTANETSSGTYTKSFSVPAPSIPGTFDLEIQVFGDNSGSSDNGCNGFDDDTYSLNNAITRVTRLTVSALLDGLAALTTAPGASITTLVTGSITGGGDGDWDATRWRFATTPPGSMTCANTSDSNSAGTFAKSFTTTAPMVPGVYNAYFRIDGSGSCSPGQEGTLLSVSNALTVVTPGTIVVDKVTDPAGDVQAFSFTTTGAGYAGFSLADADAPNSQTLPPGTYSVAETPLAGWVSAGASCVSSILDTETIGSIELDAGETVTCTFNNTKLGSLTTRIATTPDSTGQSFGFVSAAFGGAFSLTDSTGADEGMQVGSLPAGTYSIATTTTPAGWVFDSYACDSGEADPLAINLTPGENVICTAAYTKLATFSLTKFTDPAIGSYQFDLTGGVFAASTTLTPAGSWNLIDLTPGAYSLSETIIDLPDTDPVWVRQASCNGIYTDPSGSIDGVSLALGLPAGEAMSCIVNNTQKSVISGKKFEDMDGLGAGTTGPGLQNWQILVKRLDDDTLTDGVDESVTQPEVSTLTNATGDYSFLLTPGMYRVCEAPQASWYQSVPTTNVGCAGFVNGYTVTVAAGEVLTGQDFGNYRYGTISGTKWQDDDLDGTINGGETGLNGWMIKVYDSSWTGVVSVPTIAGVYTTPLLAPGTYYVTEIQQDGWAQTYPAYPADNYHTVTLASNGVVVGKNFGNVPDATISGTKYEDVNSDGVVNGADAALTAVQFTMTLYSTDGAGNLLQLLGSTTTHPVTGTYTFTGLIPGNYRVIEQPVSGWQQTMPGSNAPQDVVISSVNEDVTGTDFANTRVSTVSGSKWSDLDGDATWDLGEPGLSGWTITATPVTDGTGATIDTARPTLTTVTDGSGAYELSFLNGQIGWWKITETAQPGWLQTYPATSMYLVEVAASTAYLGRDFGNWEKPNVVVEKWNDLDNDGIRDWNDTVGILPGEKEPAEPYTEPVLSGWTMALAQFSTTTGSTTAVHVIDMATTNAAGTTTLRSLAPGEYYVFEVAQSGWNPTFPAMRTESVSVTFDPSFATTTLVTNRFFTLTVPAGTTGGTTFATGASSATTSGALSFGNFLVPTPAPAPSTGGGGNGPISGSFLGAFGGQVLGISTTSAPGTQPAGCSTYLTGFMRPGQKNDPEQVRRLQYILAVIEKMDVPQDGVYGPKTIAAVNAFQVKYASRILTPWGLTKPTGNVYLTTRRVLNEVYCNGASLFPLTAEEQAVLDAYRARTAKAAPAPVRKTTTVSVPVAAPVEAQTTSVPAPEDTVVTNNETEPQAGAVGAPTQTFFSQIGSFFSNLFGN